MIQPDRITLSQSAGPCDVGSVDVDILAHGDGPLDGNVYRQFDTLSSGSGVAVF